MRVSTLVSLALAGIAAAQSSVSLEQALESQNSSLSTLNGLLQTQPDIVSALNNATNVTLLAPNNDALNKFLNNSAVTVEMAQNPGLLIALLNYHVLDGVYYVSNFTNSSTFIPTMLTNETYANITGGQRVQALLENGTTTFYTWLKENSSVVTPNVNFTGGTIQIVDSVLSVPLDVNQTLYESNLTAAVGAIEASNLEDALLHERDVTIFAPDNGAFNNIGNLTANWTTDQLDSVLKYHVVLGQVDYSTLLGNTSLPTADGNNITIQELNGTFYVNSAKIIIQDVLVSNGVVHVIDNVLNPSNTTVTPNPTGTNPPAFSSAGTASGGVPFTSGIAPPTSTVPVATTANPGGVQATSTSKQAAPAMRTGAVGAAALFGGAVVFMNL